MSSGPATHGSDPQLQAVITRWSSPRFRLDEETWSTVDGLVTRPVIHHPGAVAVIAQPEPGLIVLVRQWRYALRRWTYEIPAGTRVSGEVPEVTAARELREEAGLHPLRLREVLRCFPAAGVSDEEMIMYHCAEFSVDPATPDQGELISAVTVDIDRAQRLVATVPDAKTLLALQWLTAADRVRSTS